MLSKMRIYWYGKGTDDSPHLTRIPSRQLDFPVEILQEIISLLPRSSLSVICRVCRTWYSVSMPVLYRHLYIRTLPHWLALVRTMSNTNFASKYGHFVSSLVLKPSPPLISSQLTSALNQSAIQNDDTIQPGTRGYSRVHRVNYDLTGLENINKPWDPLLGNNNRDKNATFEHENYSEIDTAQKESEWLSHVTDDNVSTVLQYCNNLQYLSLCGCDNLTDQVLFTVANSKKNGGSPIIGLWLCLLRKMTVMGIQALIRVEKQNRTVHGIEPTMHYLDIGFLVDLTDNDIRLTVEHWGSTLTHLRLNSIYGLTDISVELVSRYCPNLILLHLSRCWQITNPALRLLSTRCTQLKYVSVAFLSHCNETGMKHLMYNCPQLMWMDITGSGINSLMKPHVLNGWAQERIQRHLGPVHIEDSSLNLL
ncbi:hypothetical protein BDB01DRAFT_322162 [Pilobolus umbonatus]|nr:hypothetical protein BDB01DRAFT_322162 [Pilobolus umbonatus]